MTASPPSASAPQDAVASSGRWAVCAPHALASRAGGDVLARGGNAVDAAVAAATVLAVAYPNQCSPGGDLIALVGRPDGAVEVLNASGRAPVAADAAALDGLAAIPLDGGLPVTVPGAVAGWFELGRRWGTRDVADAVADAAALARDGVPVVPGLARALVEEAARIAADPGLAGVLLRDGEVPASGATLRQTRLADTLDAVAAGGPEAFYTGEIAASLVRTLRAHGSAMTAEDLASHTGTVERPLTADFGTEVHLASGGNTQGGYHLLGLRLLDALRTRLGRVPDPLGPDAADVARVLLHAAARRDAGLADPAAGADAALAEVLAAGPDDLQRLLGSVLGGASADGSGADGRARRPGGDTVAVVTADADGGWVCLIQSVFHAFGAGLLDPATGVLLHNRGAAFRLDPRHPGVLAGGRRPPHTLMPVLVRDGASGRLVGAHGTMGGHGQPQIQAHLALHVALGRSPAQAVTSPRWVLAHADDGGPLLCVEDDVPAVAAQGLQGLGVPVQQLTVRSDDAGHAQLIRAVRGDDAAPGRLAAASDPRADGAAVTDTTP